ncbi:MAG: hypothetical protein KAJ23_14910 [Maribacter sp.]|nr:hypothetical protein [Maribacter sp.]
MKNLFCLFLLVTSISFGQNYLGQHWAFSKAYPSYSFQADINLIIDGSPYIDSAFKTGFTTIRGKFGIEAPMRYNAEKNVMEFLDSHQVVREVFRRPYITVNIDEKIFRVVEYKNEREQKLGYFNPLNTGKVQLLLMPKKELSHKKRTGLTESRATYREVSSYYIKREGRPAEKIKLREKSILIHLFDKVVEMNTYISDYGLNLRKEEDVVRLLDHYNSLSTLKHSEKEMQS